MSRIWWIIVGATVSMAVALIAIVMVFRLGGVLLTTTQPAPPTAAVTPEPAPVNSAPKPISPDPEPASPIPSPTPPLELVAYTGPVEHIFFHPLVVDPAKAFKGDMAKGYNDWFVTVNEFDRIINSLYKNNYMLVDIRSLYEEQDQNGKPVLVKKTLLLPPGKKPLVLSIDDMNYYDYMRQHGNIYRLILDQQGNTASEWIDGMGERVLSYDNEIVPILDSFVRAHPDFSLNGAKGLIALTGYEGILGYRTNNTAAANYESEKQAALRLVQHLKETGWAFAAHGWGHLDAAKIKYDTLVRDTTRWQQEVRPLVGPTSIYVYPFGSQLFPGDPKFQFLLEQGFQVLCSVGGQPYLQVTPSYARMDRRHIDGLALHSQRSLLLPLFDAATVIDQSVRGTEY